MSIYAESNQTSSIPPLEAGTYVARCYQMVNLGTQEESFEGAANKPKKKVRLSFELPEEFIEYTDKEGVHQKKVRTASKEFALSMHEKASLRKFLAAWRGGDFTPEEAKKFDVTKLLGVPCLLTIESNAKGYPDIKGAARLMKNQASPAPVNQVKALTFDEWDHSLFESLPEYVRKKIELSPEYKVMLSKKDKKVLDHVPDPVEEDPMPF